MRPLTHFAVIVCSVLLLTASLTAQATKPTTAPETKPDLTRVVATVNGQKILEKSVQRALTRVPAQHHKTARKEIVNVLVEQALMDQYLQQIKIPVAKKEVDERLQQMKDAIKKRKLDFEKMLKEMMLTQEELLDHVAADLRWEKFVKKYVTDGAAKAHFEKNKEMFDGSMVRASHVLITPKDKKPESLVKAKEHATALKANLQKQVDTALAKLPKDADKLTRAKKRVEVLDKEFAALAKKESACPSKQQGGDLGWFPRNGMMVEAFAKEAFRIQPYQLSDVVETQFGAHFILVTERKKGRDVKYKDASDIAKRVYQEKLRRDLMKQLKEKSKIVISPSQ